MIGSSLNPRQILRSMRTLTSYNSFRRQTQLTVSQKYRLSSSPSSKQEFAKTFLVRIQYKRPTDAYYETYPHREEFRKQIKKLEDSNKCYVLGGDLFPFQSTQLVFNSDQKALVMDFLKNNVYQANHLIQKYQIEEVQKISQENLKKLSYFYQYA